VLTPLPRAAALIVAVIATAGCSTSAEAPVVAPAPPTQANAGAPPVDATAWTSREFRSPDGSSVAWDTGDRTQSVVYVRQGQGGPRLLLVGEVPFHVAAW
jgi:hypothetical protein